MSAHAMTAAASSCPSSCAIYGQVGLQARCSSESIGTWRKRLPTILEEPEGSEDSVAPGSGVVTSNTPPVSPQQAALEAELGNPLKLRTGGPEVNKAMAHLESSSKVERRAAVIWLTTVALELSLSKHGCRAVQKALEVATGAERDALAGKLWPHVMDLCMSPHGNYVLARMVEVLPSASLSPVLEAFAGRAAELARHRFGCRVLERLVEHCLADQVSALVDEIVEDAERLCSHQYGNFVVQSILEHMGTASARVLRKLLPRMPQLAVHRTASHVVTKAIVWCDADGQRAIAQALLGDALADIACDRFGRQVAEELAASRACGGDAKTALALCLPKLSACEAGQSIIENCGLASLPAARAQTCAAAAAAA